MNLLAEGPSGWDIFNVCFTTAIACLVGVKAYFSAVRMNFKRRAELADLIPSMERRRGDIVLEHAEERAKIDKRAKLQGVIWAQIGNDPMNRAAREQEELETESARVDAKKVMDAGLKDLDEALVKMNRERTRLNSWRVWIPWD